MKIHHCTTIQAKSCLWFSESWVCSPGIELWLSGRVFLSKNASFCILSSTTLQLWSWKSGARSEQPHGSCRSPAGRGKMDILICILHIHIVFTSTEQSQDELWTRDRQRDTLHCLETIPDGGVIRTEIELRSSDRSLFSEQTRVRGFQLVSRGKACRKNSGLTCTELFSCLGRVWFSFLFWLRLVLIEPLMDVDSTFLSKLSRQHNLAEQPY